MILLEMKFRRIRRAKLMFERFLSWISGFADHLVTIGIAVSGFSLLTALKWLDHLDIQEAHMLNRLIANLADPNTFTRLSYVFLVICILFASFLTWNDERDLTEQLARP